MGVIVAQLESAPPDMNSSLIVERFEQWRAASLPVALVTVFETVGSTYSKPGHRILIDAGGDFQGLVSGGCLEGDLAEHAAAALATGTPRVVTYDLRDEADELFGLGVGCDGMLRMLVQPLSASTDYAPFASIAAGMVGDERTVVATVVDTDRAEIPLGATLVWSRQGTTATDLDEPTCAAAVELCAATTPDAGPGVRRLDAGVSLLVAPLLRVPKLLILGAGIDAVPLVSMAAQLGWHVHIADHRPAYLERAAFSVAKSASLVVPGALAEQLDVDGFDAIIVMSHHLLTDEAFLRELIGASCDYIGVLGPPARREKLLTAIGETESDFARRLRGPVGLDLGADSAETIALSILAEIQLVLGGRAAPR